MEVSGVLQGEFDYNKLAGPTGPIAYPAGFCWIYGALRWLNLEIISVQVLFGVLYLATLAVVFQIYRKAHVPGWLLALCVLSKRVHSVYCLRLFNDGVAQFFLYLGLLLFLQGRHSWSALVYSLAVSVKMHPLLYCPAVGLSLVLFGGWSHALRMVLAMVFAQFVLAIPFLHTNPTAYFMRAFGGPGDLQHAWSVNWRMLPGHIFMHKSFEIWLRICHAALLACFAHYRWIPKGWLDKSIRQWSARASLDAESTVCIWFTCNLVGVACLRTLHFQYIVWYFHTVPFLAWFAIKPDRHRGCAWAARCVAVVSLTVAVEIPYLLTTRGVVHGPDGRSWETEGVPTQKGSCMLQGAHGVLLALVACRWVHQKQSKGS